MKVGKNLDAKGYGVATTKNSGLLHMVRKIDIIATFKCGSLLIWSKILSYGK